MNLRIARALLQTTVITMAAASCGCAGNLPRLCLNPHDAGRWSPLAAAPDVDGRAGNVTAVGREHRSARLPSTASNRMRWAEAHPT
jgi:hypothetical protein